MSETEPILDETARKAVHAARDAQFAVELSRKEQEERMGEVIRNSMTDVLSMGSDRERAIVLARVPYICTEIEVINKRLEKIQKDLRYSPLIQMLVFGMVAIMMTILVTAFVMSVLK